MKLNCDLGESFGAWQKGDDQAIMPLIDLANIACGFHASDPLTMQKTVKLAVKHKVTIGAHPSYPDLVGFGRRSFNYDHHELVAIIQYQLGALQGICANEKSQISYVKPHGALYNDMMANEDIFRSVCQAIAQFDHTLPLMMQALPNTEKYQKIAAEFKLTLWFEAFADRAYQDNGLLVSRSTAGAVIQDAQQVVNRCRTLLQSKQLTSVNGKPLALNVDTLCVHGDNPVAVELVQKLRAMLDEQ